MPSRVISLFLLAIPFLRGDTVSPLTARGYTVLPIPQRVSLGSRDFALTDGWQFVLELGVQAGDIAGRSLNELLNERCVLSLSEKGASRAGIVRLTVAPTPGPHSRHDVLDLSPAPISAGRLGGETASSAQSIRSGPGLTGCDTPVGLEGHGSYGSSATCQRR